eukprot:symbB.v1.2.011728.t1/scaffold699.1/size171451/5
MFSLPQLATSDGSFGHPETCRPPCVQIVKNGTCHLGFACGFCHMAHGKKMRLDKCQRLIMKHADRGQRLEIVVPIIIKKLEKIGGPESMKLVQLLQRYVAHEHPEGEWQKRLRQVKIHRSLERMNTTALLDLAGAELFASDVLDALRDLREKHIPFACQEEPDSVRLTLFSL